MRSITLSLICILLTTTTVVSEDAVNKSPYNIVIDGGSTGSRLHIFEFVVVNETTGQTNCVRRGSARSYKPLSSFARRRSPETPNPPPLNATYVAEHIMNLFSYAAEIIPEGYHLGTTVTYQATAGMRLLEYSEQQAIYDALYEGLMENDKFVFRRMQRDDLATLSGEMEGFYGVVAANYLKGVVDSKLRTTDEGGDNTSSSSTDSGDDNTNGRNRSNNNGPLGAMDMGGSSTQIVYMPGAEKEVQQNEEENNEDMPSRLHEESFFSVSHLAYGVDRFRERLWDTWINEQESDCNGEQEDESCSHAPILNPCANQGYELERNGYKLIGTGDADECVRQVQRLIPHHEPDTEQITRRVAGVEHPPLRGKFVAMSLYFFSLDSLRVLSEPSKDAHEALNKAWPTPSIAELHDALDGLCSRSWHDDLVHIQHNSHAYTRAEVLPHRCFESVYMATLLRDGYGFHPDSRDITFTFLVDGSEVEWSLGMALTKHAEEYEAALARQRSTDSNNTYEEECEPPQPPVVT